LLISLIIASLINNCFAKDSVPLNKGDLSPFTGILLSTKKAEQVREELIERDQLKIFNKALLQKIDGQDKIISNQNKQVKLLNEQNNKLMKEIESRKTTTFERVMWFSLGVIVTSAAVYGASRVVGK
jgi:hypothetical protein